MLDDYPLFDDLPSIGGSLRIQNNAAMSTFPSFNSLTMVTADLHFEGMPLPTALPDFASLMSVGGNIVLKDNAALSSCCSFLEILNSASGTVNITGNASGCATRSEVGNSCYTGGNLNIDNASKVPGNVRLITRINGNLIIRGGSHRSFPDFAALTEVTGSITVQSIHNVSGTSIRPPGGTGGTFAADNIFPELDRVGGDIVFEQNFNIGSFRNVFAKLRRVGGVIRFGRASTSTIVYANSRFDALTGFDLLESVKGFALYEDRRAERSRLTNIANFPTFPKLTRVGSEGILINGFVLDELEDADNGRIIFSNLERVEGSVQFFDSEEVRSLPSFPKLRFVGGDVVISGLEALPTISGFNALRVLRGILSVTNKMESLRTVEGFNVLETVLNVNLTAFDALRRISGFNNLKSVTEIGASAGLRLRVDGAGRVTEAIEVTGFERLEEIAGQFLISGAFSRVPDFSSLRAVTFITISNTRLTELPSFNSLRSVNRLTLLNNSSMTNCCAIKHINITDLQRPEVIFRGSNAQGCRSANDINTNCRRDIDVPPTIRLSAVGGSSDLYVNVRNNTPWRLMPEAGATWLSNYSVVANNNARNITYDFAQNTGAERRATLTVSSTGTGEPVSETITVIQRAASTRELLTPNLSYRLSNMSNTRTIEIYSNVPWAITGAPAWLSLNNTSKDGSGMPMFTVSLNTTPSERTATLMLSSTDAGTPISHTITVVQEAGEGVERSLVVTPNATITLSADAGSSGEVKVVSNVPWSATKNRNWITSVSPSSGGTGTTTVNINWNRNTTTSERTGRISFMSTDPGVTVLTDGVNVSQQGGMPPPFIRSSPRSDEVVESAGYYTFMIDSNRSWRSRKTRSSDWVTLNPNRGSSGTTVVRANYSANPGPNRRSERWEFTTDGDPSDGASFVLNQIAPGTVLLTINPTSELVFMDVGGMVNREITSNVSWSVVNATAGSDIPGWLTVTPSMGSSSQTITITCSPHSQSAQRRVTLRLHSRGVSPQETTNIVIRQTGRLARSLEGPGTITLPPTVGMRTFNVRSNTSWEITKNAAATWITNIAPRTGSNNRSVEITFTLNPGTTERQTTLVLSSTVSGVNLSKNIVIKQSGAAAPFLSGPTTISVPSAGGRRRFAISSNVDWEIVGFPSWITSFLPSRTGNGDAMVDFVFQANPNQTERVGTFRLEEINTSTPVAPAMIEVKQAPRVVVNQRSLSVTPAQKYLTPIMGSVNLTVSSTIPWRVTGVPAWVTLSPTSGTADATVKLTHQANASSSQRDAMITFRNTDTGTSIIRSVNISQGGARRARCLFLRRRSIFFLLWEASSLR